MFVTMFQTSIFSVSKIHHELQFQSACWLDVCSVSVNFQSLLVFGLGNFALYQVTT